MKKILVVFAIFAALIFVISCGGGSKTGDNTNTGDTTTDNDTGDSGSTDTEPGEGDTEPTETPDSDNPDTAPDAGDSVPDNGDSTPDNDADSGDSAPDSDNEEPVNENPDNLPECSPTSATPCIDSETGLIWSGKAPERIRWIDAVDHCKNLKEGGYNDWKLPTIAALETLVKQCESNGYSDGECSKLGDIVFFWSGTNTGTEASGVFFYNGATQTKNVDETFDARCVRRDRETRNVNCTGLPAEHAEWNSVSNIAQTWDWDSASWIPSQTASYSEEPATVKCIFKCEDNYVWDSSICTDKPNLGSICTGQDKCYNDGNEIACPVEGEGYYGEDAQYAALETCTTQSFSSTSNVVIDNNIGLAWEKSPSEETYTWDDAPNHCIDLNNSNYGGINTWRVPNPLELLTIVDNSKYNPATNSNFTGIPTDSDIYFWTSKEYKGNTSGAYAFRPEWGTSYYSRPYSGQYSKTNTYKVLCVSGDEMRPAISSNFTTQTINDSVVVTDSKTSLMWQKKYEKKTWGQALKYCEGSTYAGYSDWRLPNKNELASLVNYEKSGEPYSYFPGMPSEWFWSSSTSLRNDTIDLAWDVSFVYGVVGNSYKTSTLHTICVRNAD